MKPCPKVGVDVTWRCNAKCMHCYHLRNLSLHKAEDVPLNESKAKIDRAKAGGLDHVYLVGKGEPSLAPTTVDVLDYAHRQGMATSMITNATTGLYRFKGYCRQGIDHLHISSHGVGRTLDDIMGVSGAFRKQAEVKEWLASEGLPFRTNTTILQRNYQTLPDIVEYEIASGVFHFSFLGFLPHYEWKDHVREVAVHPAKLRPYIEDAADQLIESGTYFTIRYQPMCHLAPKYWKYVVNARYVLFCPGEWNYSLQAHDEDALWRDSVNLGESVACHDPCDECVACQYCGGWNRVYAEAFGGADLKAIKEVPDEYKHAWGQREAIHDLNPFNQLTGTIQKDRGDKS